MPEPTGAGETHIAAALAADVVRPHPNGPCADLACVVCRRLVTADALCQAWEDELAYSDGADVARPDLDAARDAWKDSRG